MTCGRRRRDLEEQHARARLEAVLANVVREADQREDRLLDGELGDVGAAAVAPHQPAFAFEVGERLPDGDAADVELLAEPPFGGYLGIGRPLAGVDELLDGALQLVIERDGARFAQSGKAPGSKRRVPPRGGGHEPTAERPPGRPEAWPFWS